MIQDHLLSLLIIVALTACVVVQVIVCFIMRELFHYLRGSHNGLYDRLDYVVGGIEVLKEDNTHLHKRIGELFTGMRHVAICPYAEQKKTDRFRTEANGK